MISIDSSEARISSLKSVARKGRLARSLDFTKHHTTTNSVSRPRRRTALKKTSDSIWRDPLKSVLPQSTGFTTHKMSSVTNTFMSSDLVSSSSSSDSEIDEMVGNLVDPGRATLVFPQHDEVFRTSPLSSSSYGLEDSENVDAADFPVTEDSPTNFPEFNFYNSTTGSNNSAASGNVGMSWNPKRNQWIPLIYRYVFPSSAFAINNNVSNNTPLTISSKSTTTWSLKNGQLTESRSTASFSFQPPKKSIMMGPDGLNGTASDSKTSACKVDLDARDVCEKLLELMDDENLMLPVVKISTRSSSPLNKCRLVNNGTKNCTTSQQQQQQQIIPGNTGKSLLSEWSSLPSSPPPPIFHDVCNRPIPELRLSPPMTGKSVSKRLFPANAAITTNSPCESPLTKRLRFSNSSSSITSQ